MFVTILGSVKRSQWLKSSLGETLLRGNEPRRSGIASAYGRRLLFNCFAPSREGLLKISGYADLLTGIRLGDRLRCN